MSFKIQEINRDPAEDSQFAYLEILRRNNANLELYGDFYFSNTHSYKVDRTKEIVTKFFSSYKKMYINRRASNGKPFTAIKLVSPVFPKEITSKEIHKLYYEPLEKLGVSIIHSPGTSSYIFRVW